jgi:hypothetical protein
VSRIVVIAVEQSSGYLIYVFEITFNIYDPHTGVDQGPRRSADCDPEKWAVLAPSSRNIDV